MSPRTTIWSARSCARRDSRVTYATRTFAQTYDLGKVGDIYFIAMELVVGRTLRDILRLFSKTGGRIPIPIALNVLNQVCDALDYAHNLTDDSGQALGIIHRDVSPSNVIVSDGGVVKLIDFGIAKASAAGMQTMSARSKASSVTWRRSILPARSTRARICSRSA